MMPTMSFATSNQTFEEAIILIEKKEYAQARDLLHDLEASLLDPEQIANLLAFACLGSGYQLLSSGDYSTAREAFVEGRRYKEDDVRLWQGEAMVLMKQGQYSEAASLLDQALGVAPQNADIYYFLGQSYYADGRMSEALDALASAVELGGGTDVSTFQEKVLREWQVEQAMGREVRGHFELAYVDGHGSRLAASILEILEDAYTELGSDLAFYPEVRVPVLLYSSRDFSAVTNSPDWAGALYDGKIRLPLGGMNEMSDSLAALLYHEYMHVLVHFLVHQEIPVWLNEGLAGLAGRRLYSLPMVHLQRAVEGKMLIGWDSLSGSFADLDHARVPLAYEQSCSLVMFLVDRFGWDKMKEFLERLDKQQSWQTVIADVYQDFGLDWPAILTEWQASLSHPD